MAEITDTIKGAISTGKGLKVSVCSQCEGSEETLRRIRECLPDSLREAVQFQIVLVDAD